MKCAAAVEPVRAQPRESAEQVTQALAGEPLRVEERRGGWARIVTAYGYPGWVREAAVEDGEGALPVAEASSPLAAARRYLGAPYEWGGLTQAGIDCSGLVHIAYRATGRLVPRDSWQQEAAGISVASGEERPGDLVTYGEREKADHIAFWLSAENILHATSRHGLGVVEEPEPAELRARRRGIVSLYDPSRNSTPSSPPKEGSS
ncbi:MAG TPA: C40 family peptidase [Gaiellaceae bacterium]|nr:C40 family peptidase [Gaiellaceae bacterium]